MIPDELYPSRAGTTDSEAIFLGLLGCGLMGAGPRRDPVEATARALVRLTELAGEHPFRFTAALADGRDLYAFRYAANDKANSLYYRASDGGVVVASEPLDRDHGTWTSVSENSVLIARRNQPVEILPLASFGLRDTASDDRLRRLRA